jgi:ribosomal protein S18 acetylase RimI-like enzyme
VSLNVRMLSLEDAIEGGRILAESMMVEPGYASILTDEAVRRQVLVPLVTNAICGAIHADAAFGAFRDGTLLGVAAFATPGSYPLPSKPDDDGSLLPPYLRQLPSGMLQGLMAYDDACVAHFPDEPAWYLMYLGVHPDAQGTGAGSALLRSALDDILRRETAPVYLETGTERNVRFYQRFGFRVREANIALVPGPVRHWTMIRDIQDPRIPAS